VFSLAPVLFVSCLPVPPREERWHAERRALWGTMIFKWSVDMKIAVCGIACEKCPRMAQGKCPSGEKGCVQKENKFCKIATCAFEKKVRLCFECASFPCETTKSGPINYGYCQYISGRAK
jgi:hypothetical protein